MFFLQANMENLAGIIQKAFAYLGDVGVRNFRNDDVVWCVVFSSFNGEFERDLLFLDFDGVLGVAAEREVVFEAGVSEVDHHEHVVARLQTLLVDHAVARLRRNRLLLQHFAVRVPQQNVELVLVFDVAVGRHHSARQLVEGQEQILLADDAERVLPILTGPFLMEAAPLPVIMVIGDVVVLEGPFEGSHVHVEEALAVSV